RTLLWFMPVALVGGLLGSAPTASAKARSSIVAKGLRPRVTRAVAFDVSAPLRVLARRAPTAVTPHPLPPERGPVLADRGYSGDGAVQSSVGAATPTIPATTVNFEGLANSDNPFQVSPPDPVG